MIILYFKISMILLVIKPFSSLNNLKKANEKPIIIMIAIYIIFFIYNDIFNGVNL